MARAFVLHRALVSGPRRYELADTLDIGTKLLQGDHFVPCDCNEFGSLGGRTLLQHLLFSVFLAS